MRNLLLIILLFNVIIGKSQKATDCDKNIWLHIRKPNTLKIVRINADDYDKLENETEIEFQEIESSIFTESSLVRNYDFIKRTEYGISISCKNTQFNLENIEQENIKANKGYKVKYLYKEKYVVFYETVFEGWTFYLIDLKNEIGYTLPSKPKFIENSYIYGNASYFGNQDFEVYNLEDNTHVIFSIGGKSLEEYYFENNKLKFKVKNLCNERDVKRIDYFEINLFNSL